MSRALKKRTTRPRPTASKSPAKRRTRARKPRPAVADDSREGEIAEAYRRAYADGGGLGKEWEGWEKQGAWPED